MPPQTNQPSETGVTETNTGFNTTPGTESALFEALHVIRKRRWIVIVAAALGIAFGIYQAITQAIVYSATGRIEVRGSSGQSALNMIGAVSNFGPDDLATEVLVLTSQSLMLNVAQEMNLANNPDFMEPGSSHRNINDPIVRTSVLKTLSNSLQVDSIANTQMITITATASKPQLAADLVNHLINAYQQRSFESRFASTQRVSQWLQGQLDDLKQQVETSQEQLMDQQKRIGVLGMGDDASKPVTTQVTAAIEALSDAAIKAKVERILAESRYRVLASSDPNLLEGAVSSQGGNALGLSKLRDDVADTKTQIAQSLVTLGPRNPQVLTLQTHLREVERQMKVEENRILAEAKQALTAAQANEAQTTAALEDQKNQSYQLRDDLVEYTLRQRDYETNRALYEELLAKLRSASVQAGLDALEIDVVDNALKPAGPNITPRSRILAKDLLLGLAIGIVIAFAMESLDTGIQSVAEVEQITQLPSLSIIPRVRRLSSDGTGSMTVAQTNIGVLSASKSQFSEAFRSLRTALLLATTGHPPKIILISSSNPSEGKTTVATNLAAILAQGEARVLLIDADLRRPNVHHRFGLNGRIGLSTVLSGSASLTEAVKNVPEAPNLDVLCSGPVPPFPTEMLSSDSMQKLLAECAATYTHIVIDTPPILSVTDGIILLRYADASVLVVRHGKSSRHAVRRARDLLVRSGAAIAGVVLNSIDSNTPEYNGYYGYSGYGYSGYGYSNIDTEAWEPQENPSQRNDDTKKGDEA